MVESGLTAPTGEFCSKKMTVTVKIVARSRSGKTLRQTRIYRTCV
jgi:hypothetical protein